MQPGVGRDATLAFQDLQHPGIALGLRPQTRQGGQVIKDALRKTYVLQQRLLRALQDPRKPACRRRALEAQQPLQVRLCNQSHDPGREDIGGNREGRARLAVWNVQRDALQRESRTRHGTCDRSLLEQPPLLRRPLAQLCVGLDKVDVLLKLIRRQWCAWWAEGRLQRCPRRPRQPLPLHQRVEQRGGTSVRRPTHDRGSPTQQGLQRGVVEQ
mmetsp:Transcript_6261/g.11689  ORF Transcript_6261/g.11689 Transcript_6261/m.11689 type:complete len:213 (-) Transcript_6261:335-973(-)